MNGVGGIEVAANLRSSRLAECLGPVMRQRLVAYACRFVADAMEAEDVAQEVLLRAGTDPAGLLAAERADAWLLRMCRHVAIDHVRARRVRQVVWSAMPDGAEAQELEADRARPMGRLAASARRRFCLKRRVALHPRAAHVSLRDLPSPARLLMSLYYEKGLSQPTICRMTGLSAPALRVRLFRARGALVARAQRGGSDTRA